MNRRELLTTLDVRNVYFTLTINKSTHQNTFEKNVSSLEGIFAHYIGLLNVLGICSGLTLKKFKCRGVAQGVAKGSKCVELLSFELLHEDNRRISFSLNYTEMVGILGLIPLI